MKFPKPGYGFAAVTILVSGILGWLPTKGLALRFAKQLFSEITFVLALTAFFVRNKWIKLFVFWAVLSAIPHYSKWSHLSVLTIAVHLMAYEWFSRTLTEERIQKVLNAVCVVGIIQALWMVLQSAGIWILVYSTNRYPGAVFGFQDHHNLAAALLALTLPAFFREKYNLFIPFIWYGLFLSKSLSGILPAAIVTAIYVFIRFRRDKRILSLFTCLFLASGWAYVTFFENLGVALSSQGRFGTWAGIFQKMVAEKWLTGWGIGEFKIVWNTIYKAPVEPFLQAHNDYLQVWAEIGLIGLIIVSGFIGNIIFNYLHGILKGKPQGYHLAFAGFFITVLNAFANFLFHTPVAIISLMYFSIIQFYETNQRSAYAVG